FSGDLPDGLADILLEFRLVIGPLHDEMADFAADAFLDDFQFLVGLFMLALDARPQLGILHLADFLFGGAGGNGAPRRARIVKVPIFQREGEAGAQRGGLAENRQTLFAAALQPGEAALVRLGILTRGGDRIVEDGTTRRGGEALDEREVILDVAGRL